MIRPASAPITASYAKYSRIRPRVRVDAGKAYRHAPHCRNRAQAETPLADAYEEWLKQQPATPATRGQKEKVEADVYEAWLRQRVERKRSRR